MLMRLLSVAGLFLQGIRFRVSTLELEVFYNLWFGNVADISMIWQRFMLNVEPVVYKREQDFRASRTAITTQTVQVYPIVQSLVP